MASLIPCVNASMPGWRKRLYNQAAPSEGEVLLTEPLLSIGGKNGWSAQTWRAVDDRYVSQYNVD
jgi:hypothetical protein